MKSRKDLKIPEKAFVVGTIGRLTEQKAPDIFVKMAKEIKPIIPEAFFLMVGDDIGDGSYRKKINLAIKNEGLSKSFIITGWVDNPFDYLNVFDVGTLLSRWEGFGLVLLEYMITGKPIVATKADAIPYVVGEAGLLSDVDDYKQAAELVVRLYKEEELKNRIVKIGKERVKLFDAKKTAYEHIKLFRSIEKY